jgi:hypothetical protein
LIVIIVVMLGGPTMPPAMESNRDIYRAASILVEGYGRELAPGMALRRSDAVSSRGDVRGSLVWMNVFEAVQQLIPDRTRPG